jgi:hypothetical protein
LPPPADASRPLPAGDARRRPLRPPHRPRGAQDARASRSS